MNVIDIVAADLGIIPATPSLPAINDAKRQTGLSLAQIAAIVMTAYTDRPALGQRATEIRSDRVTGRRTRRHIQRYDTISYADVWSQANALAATWANDPLCRVIAGDMVCSLGFASIDYVVVDLATIVLGAVAVPIQTNAPIAQLIEIARETEPSCIAASLENLDSAITMALALDRPVQLIVFDCHLDDDDQRAVYDAAERRLVDAGKAGSLHRLENLCRSGMALPAPAPYVPAADADSLCTIHYTSGSTGSPKGAMWPESMVIDGWLGVSPNPVVSLSYMPMNHSFGRTLVFSALANGGTCCFVGKSDLSTLFEDISIVRPTQISLVPRVCELLYQRYLDEIARRTTGGESAADADAIRTRVLTELRNVLLGGRIRSSAFGAAPLGPEIRAFLNDCMGFTVSENYGGTEAHLVTFNSVIVRPAVIDYKLVDVPELGYFSTDKPHPRGELLVKTRNIMLGYYKRPDLTATVFDADNFYKTGDIMAEIGRDRLIWLDRRNNVLKLSQGEFVAISKLEAQFIAASPLINQLYLYGNSQRSYLLGVIVPSPDLAAMLSAPGGEAKVKGALRDAINKIARADQLQTFEVPRDFLIETEPFTAENGLLTNLRKPARAALKSRYGDRLESLYTEMGRGSSIEIAQLRQTGADAPVIETVSRAIEATLSIAPLDPAGRRNSLAGLGGDSLAALSLSLLLEDIYGFEIPASVINNPVGTVEGLAAYIARQRDGGATRPTPTSVHGDNATTLRGADFTLDKFIDTATLENASLLPAPEGPVRSVLMTGANGFLGRFLCLEWLERMASVDGKVICIARGRDKHEARRRIAAAFDSGDTTLKARFDALAEGHLEVLAGDLSEVDLGLDGADWTRLTRTVDLIVHVAAFVNHLLPYGQLFGPNVVGTSELVRLALTTKMKRFNYISSVGVALIEDEAVIDEVSDIRVACPTRRLDSDLYARGYNCTKWAGEVLLREAHEHFGVPVVVFRPDMILAHSRYHGQINVPDMFTRWLSSVLVTGVAPRSFYRATSGPNEVAAHYDGLPVDFIAVAIATLALDPADGFATYSVANPHDDGISLDRIIDWMIAAGLPIQRIDDYDQWYLRFEGGLRQLPERDRQKTSYPLLKEQFAEPIPPMAGSIVPASRFRAAICKTGAGTYADIPHLTPDFIAKCVDDLHRTGLAMSVTF